MNLGQWLEQWDLTSLKITPPFLSIEIHPRNADRKAAWDLYVELITRVSTQRLGPTQGDEAAALSSIHELFSLTRDIIKRHGPSCINFARIAVVILNQRVRPFTAAWHGHILRGPLDTAAKTEFRNQLSDLQSELRNYTRLLADLANVEDLTALEDTK